MEDNSSNIQRGYERTHHYYAINGKLMLISLVVLVAFSIIIAFFHSYARWLQRQHRRNRELRLDDHVSRHRAPPSETIRNTRKGLERSVVKSLPTLLFDSTANSLPQECAVCLSEFGDGELCRFLPNCSHCFHINCIDTWFKSHSNCPICRSPVETIAPVTRISASEAGSSSCGSYSTSHSDEDQIGRSSSSAARIKISESVSVAVDIPETNRPDSGDPTRLV